MTTVLWTIFYILTSIMIISFLFFEKSITKNLNNFSEKIFSKLDRDNLKNKNIVYGVNILNILIIIGMYVFLIDKSRSNIIPIKFYALNATILINLSFLIMNFRKDILVILNFVMLFAGLHIFGIDDKFFNYLMIITLVLDLISIYFDYDNLKNSIRVIINGCYVALIIWIIQSFYLGNYVIPTQSMEPTILVKDRIFSNNIKYKYVSPELNEIISFKEPFENKVMYTKRITGVAGTNFELKDDNRIYSNDVKINDRYYSTGSGSIYNMMDRKIYIPKKGDFVTIYKVIEYDLKNKQINILEPKEFLKNNKDADYEKLMGLYNFGTYQGEKRYSYIMMAKDHNELLLPILDFKYNREKFEKLLNGEYLELSDDYYMAMGDNTDNSQDSRYFGYVKKSRIQGSLFLDGSH